MPNRRAYGSHGAPPSVPGFTWNPVEGTMGSQYQLPQYELTPIPGYQPPGSSPIGETSGTSNVGAGVPELPDYSQVGNLIAQINAQNQQAQHAANLGRIPGAEALENQSSEAIANLFDPSVDLPSVNMDAAAAAVGSGTVGSPFAGVTGLRRRDDEITRRQTLAQQMLSSAYGRNPAAPIGDPQALLTLLQQQGFQAGQSAAQRALQDQLSRWEQQTALAIAALRGAGSHATGGGGYYGPRIPTDYGRGAAAVPATFRARIPELTDYSSSGSGTGYLIQSDAIPDNWANLTPGQQAEYAGLIAANPYYNTPDQYNPYANEYDPDVSLGAFY